MRGLKEEQSQRLVAVFAFGALLLSWPLLALFNRAALVLGIPLLVAYLFVAWALLIALMAWAVHSRAEPPHSSSGSS